MRRYKHQIRCKMGSLKPDSDFTITTVRSGQSSTTGNLQSKNMLPSACSIRFWCAKSCNWDDDGEDDDGDDDGDDDDDDDDDWHVMIDMWWWHMMMTYNMMMMMMMMMIPSLTGIDWCLSFELSISGGAGFCVSTYQQYLQTWLQKNIVDWRQSSFFPFPRVRMEYLSAAPFCQLPVTVLSINANAPGRSFPSWKAGIYGLPMVPWIPKTNPMDSYELWIPPKLTDQTRRRL